MSKLVALIVCMFFAVTPTAHADHGGNLGVSGSDTPLSPSVQIEGSDVHEGDVTAAKQSSAGVSGTPPTMEYEWLLACSNNQPGAPMTDRGSAQTCEDPFESRWVLWAREIDGGTWFQYASECYGEEPALPVQAAQPIVTAAMVGEAVRRMGLPALPLHVQPTEATLVNFETIFFTRPVPFDRSVTLVGYKVRVLADPVSYRWSFGDGSAMTTQVPGGPYPAKDVVHRYEDAHVTVQPSVDVTYQVSYTVDGGETQQLGTTLTADGPPSGLRIREASPLLAGSS